MIHSKLPSLISALAGIFWLPSWALFAEKEIEAPKRPNIVLLMAEDITLDLGCYGKPWLHTPHLDQMANEGTKYTRFYTTAPMCSASRTALMTGVYQTTSGGMHHRSRIKDPQPEGIRPLPHLLRDKGYVTVLGSEWIEPAGTKVDVNFAGWNAEYLFDYVADLATAREEHPEKPFFHQIQLALSHRWYSERWPRMRDSLPNPVQAGDIVLPPYFPDDPLVREDEAMRLSAIQYIDQQAGKLVRLYEEAGLAENTVFIFIGDNGQNQVRGKSYLYETGSLCPLIIKGPRPVPQQLVVDDLVTGVDLVATILQLSGTPIPTWVQGRPFLADPDYLPRQAVITGRDRHDEIGDCIRAVTTRRYKYIRNFMPQIPWDAGMEYYEKNRPVLLRMRELHEQDKLTTAQKRFLDQRKPKEELYDLRRDPHEINNLVEDPAYQRNLRELRAFLHEWLQESGDRALRLTPEGTWQARKEWRKIPR